MQTIGDVRNLLKQMGIVIYTGDKEADRDLMKDELDELQQMGIIDRECWLMARKILAQSSSR